MKKIGIYTLYKSLNFGAFLQAYALKETIKSLGHDVSFISFNEVPTQVQETSKMKQMIQKIKNLKKGLFRRQQEKKYAEIKDVLPISNNDQYDTIVVGSDEVWNVTNSSFPHLPEFFGLNLNAEKIISYAPSCNQSTVEDIKNYNNSLDFSNFNALSVRDFHTKEVVSAFTEHEIKLVLDPTFLLLDYNNIIKQYPIDREKFIVVYGYYFTVEQQKEIKAFARKKHLKLLAVGLYQPWCDEVISAHPFEFLSYLEKADYVITSTFHGTIFSIILKKNFATAVQKSNKISYLLSQFNLIERNFTEQPLEEVLKNSIDYISVDKIINSKREESYQYLKDNL